MTTDIQQRALMFYFSLISLLFIQYCSNFETIKSSLCLTCIAMMRVKCNLNVHKQDRKYTSTDVTYIQFIGEFSWEINSAGKTCPAVIINALDAFHQDACGRFYVFDFFFTSIKVEVHTAHKSNSKMGISQAAHFLCD